MSGVMETKDTSTDRACPPHLHHVRDPDHAFKFLEKMGAKDGIQTEVSIESVRRKVDLRILWIMFLCYTMQFIDKVSLNYAAVMGLAPDLGLQGNDFSNAATAFFIAYLVAEVPTGYVLNKVPASK